MARRQPWILCVLAAVVLAACGGDDSAPLEPPPISPTAAPEVWDVVNTEGFTAAIAPGWEAVPITKENIAELVAGGGSDLTDAFDPEQFAAFLDRLEVDNAFAVYFTESGIPNVTAFWCIDDGLALETVEDARRVYGSLEGGYELLDEPPEYRENPVAFLAKVPLVRGFDSYQTYLREGTCNVQVTFTTPEGDDADLDEFRDFIASLIIRP